MRELLAKRVFPGFRTGEAALWLGFHIASAVVLGGLYYFTGQFEQPGFLSAREFTYTQFYVLLFKALYILPSI